MKGFENNPLLNCYTLIYQYQKGLTEALSSTLIVHTVGEPEHCYQHRHHPLELRTMNHNRLLKEMTINEVAVPPETEVEAEVDSTKT